MLATEAVTQLSPRLSLRGRLYLFSGAILILFAINVGTSLWGSFARNESSIAYKQAVTAAQLTAELEQNLQNKRQQVLVLATLRETTEEPLDAAALDQAVADLEIIGERLRQLGGFGGEDLEAYYRRTIGVFTTASPRSLRNGTNFIKATTRRHCYQTLSQPCPTTIRSSACRNSISGSLLLRFSAPMLLTPRSPSRIRVQ